MNKLLHKKKPLNFLTLSTGYYYHHKFLNFLKRKEYKYGWLKTLGYVEKGKNSQSFCLSYCKAEFVFFEFIFFEMVWKITVNSYW